MFISLFEWRDTTAKQLDINPNELLSNKDLEFLTRAMPHSVENLSTLISVQSNINERQKTDIVKLIINTKENVPMSKRYGEGVNQTIELVNTNNENIVLSMSKQAKKLRRYRKNKKHKFE